MFKKTLLIALLAAATAVVADSNEGVYLSNCNEFEPGFLYSEMDYYSNAKSGSQNQEHPQATAYIGHDGSNSNGYVTWEGKQVCGFFSSSGDTFCSNIASNAASLPTGSYAGSGFNNERGFNCYKDNGRTLYTSTGVVCKSIYYCFDQ